MEVLFKNVTEYSKEEMKRFMRFHEDNNKAFTVYLMLCCLVFVIMLILNLVKKNWQMILPTLLLVGGMFCYLKFFKIKKEKQRNEKIRNKTYTFDFYSRFFKINGDSDSEETVVNYFEVKKVYETKLNFYLYTDTTHAYILNKNNFTVGKLNDFRNFIKQKCILKYRKKYKIKRKDEKKRELIK